jgi:hypothetical protein
MLLITTTILNKKNGTQRFICCQKKKNQEKRACPENYNIYLYISHQGLKDKHTYIIS